MDYQLGALADQFECHALSRSIDDVEAAGRAMRAAKAEIDRMSATIQGIGDLAASSRTGPGQAESLRIIENLCDETPNAKRQLKATPLPAQGSTAELGPDCRTCLHFGWGKQQCFSVASCNYGSAHLPSWPHYLWSRIDVPNV